MISRVIEWQKLANRAKIGDTIGVSLRILLMASLRKRKGSNVWQAQYYVPDTEAGGLKQVRKSTGQTNRKKAIAAAIELERTALGSIEVGSDASRLAKAVLAEAVAEIERGTFTGLSARKYLAKLLFIATGEELKSYTLETWSEEWLRRKARDSSKSTMARYRGHVNAFLDWLGDNRRNRPLESVTPQQVREWRESLQDAGRAGKTVLSYVKDLSAVYRAAIREGLVSFNPCSTAIGDVETSDSLDRKPFSGEEVAALLEASPTKEWRGLILVAAFTGLRLGDAARLSWVSVDLQAKQISLIPSKTKKKREVRIPIQPDLLAFFESVTVNDDSPEASVFPTLAETPVSTVKGLSTTFVGIMATAGVDRGKPSRVLKEGQTAGKGRITYERGFHSLRHTFTTWLRTAGVSEEDRMALTGHSTRESHQTYSHTDEAALRDAVAKLPRLTTDNP
ncbi:tyrosine-type recombinase/integrase [Haloferula sp.]|uniref:tyrosine-type recombinase/integrase n=1 Tax=Haloferula sp. TaxID=2497595 RepID=UPI00329A8F7A